MADRVAIFNEGRLVQIGTPRDIYEKPGTRFVADFVGSSNVLDPDFSALYGGLRAWTSLRPEHIRIGPPAIRRPDGRRLDALGPEGVVTSVQYQGAVTRVTVEVDGASLAVAVRAGETPAKAGERVTLSWRPEALHALESA
jgi:putative spermidine/putrescine transport system ATP-binding protein